MFENNEFTRVQKWILIILFFIFILLSIIFIYELIDFYNDYVCSTTTNINWYNTHNCIKYLNH